MSRQLKADMALLLVTIGWGSSFILTKNSLAKLPTYNFLTIRFFLAFIISSVIFIKKMTKIDKKTLKYGVILGICLYAHYAFQTVGLNYTSISKSAFITGFNVILVPVFASLLIKKLPHKQSILSVVLAFIGLGMLTLNENITGINIGDIYTLICAVIFALYIIFVGKYTVDSESVSLAVVQLGVVAVLSLITSFAIEKPIIPNDYQVWINIIILSVVCTSGAYIIQSIAQKFTSSTHTALIYSGEPVFAAMFAYIIYGENLSVKGTLGAILILTGMLIAELDFKKLLNKKDSLQEEIID
ncbi:DMT family transporter [Tepidibacter formicigenes]|jgi:drug/metabolite transporter (DMT)-like permease|uniref:Permease of the drug/metabolite transporter (DMT) superfamily n=1 Tax=Tepidibacter formicigenes DSM 15518 TaxID=1123349 RepID=A0A1M6U9J6_9FIRM|nr:DMT family transporter [Tepidibacter formicigenes]SHK65857.1 Permease of the drug/metabolite transporter (DMT) superfamily [Tepidibacter formicigenes DSM 15518]